ncbi:carboxypeptidase-like regulatory domain-containing protein [Geomesophilobacter sediminis]|uniref:Carboxypeptidase regulatory-like domain-containing protein n=1 Tax=Geomesophilobacter sediminis TaxID=2798584 RepID=A0A8J7M1I8_9BACT|nr:carboxypeptidase regulatory-like domain-containing protein [Geomesophilobacter sediminis]MBJ6726927.1 carboxypeptidase regulatory-like domain-containing protein [Geomesophilobacter sediminis]
MRSDHARKLITYSALCFLLLLQAALFGCSGDNGTNANAFGSVSGKVVDTYGNNVAGATVSTTVGGDPASATTDASGAYTLSLPAGARTLSFAASGYNSYAQSYECVPGKASTLNVTLNPTGAAAVMASRTDTTSPVVPGTQIALKAKVLTFDPALAGQTPTYTWSVVSGPAVAIDNANSATPTVTLANSAAFKKYLVELSTPLYKPNADEPPVNVDRYQIVPFSYEQASTQGNTTTLKVTATIGGKSYTSNVAVAAKLPAVPSNGLTNVPVNQPVVLQGQFPFKNADGSYMFTPYTSWNWSVTGPSGAVTVNDATTAYPDFTPTAPGTYSVYETVNGGSSPVLTVYAGTYVGMMTGVATPDPACNGCHNDKMTTWLQTGHKDVLYAGIREPLPDGHYAMTCTPCHTVGQGARGSNGFVDAAAAEGLTSFASLQGNNNAESAFWASNPQSARLAGVQCENCHGPQANSGQHQVTSDPDNISLNSRISFSANVCATCHARAPKHGRFSQWKSSGHASMATTTFNSNADGTLANSCACCHSAQGFRAYLKILPTANGNRSLTALPASLRLSNAEPITCAACHDSHNEGKSQGGANTYNDVNFANLASVGPDSGSTYMLPSGFAANGVGKGALCIACHNSRQGYSSGPYLHEDGDFKFGTLASYGAPHEACQGDVLMGRNAYWMGTTRYNSAQTRSKHSYIADTCVTCHMELTTLNLSLSEAGQTRHDFKATTDVCNKCHTAYSAEAVQTTFDAKLLAVKRQIGTAILQVKQNTTAPTGSAVLVANRSGMVDVTSGGVTRRWFINDKANQDAFLEDPNNGNALVQGCVANTDGTANCTGYLSGALSVTFNANAAVTATGVNGILAKALWNTVLVQDDASRGVHNPAFAFEVLDNTYAHVGTWTP